MTHLIIVRARVCAISSVGSERKTGGSSQATRNARNGGRNRTGTCKAREMQEGKDRANREIQRKESNGTQKEMR